VWWDNFGLILLHQPIKLLQKELERGPLEEVYLHHGMVQLEQEYHKMQLYVLEELRALLYKIKLNYMMAILGLK
tara:strand:- start:690 stop:911 length:222 start_codon:yes stop_codon:yes gene_type:complete